MGKFPMSWELDSIYPGGSGSTAFVAELSGLTRDVRALSESLQEADRSRSADASERLYEWTELIQSILKRLHEAESFVGCLQAQDMHDKAALALNDRVQNIAADYKRALTLYDEALLSVDEEDWREYLRSESVSSIAFNLDERREAAREKLPPEQEALAGDLAVNGYHAWGELYNTIVSKAVFRMKDPAGGEDKELSAGQLHNLLSHGDRAVREQAFAVWEEEWSRHADLCAETLNRIAGFRLKLYERRGWDSVLKEPLHINRMSEATLNAMWTAIEEGKPKLVAYLERKAKLLGLDRLDWFDVEAPLESTSSKVDYDDAAAFIVDQFRSFSPGMAEFSLKAFEEAWIEAEDRRGKRPGGFCTSFPKSGQTRIFMTYSGTPSNVSTLAHELGHAYHQEVMDDLPPLNQEYAMNVAETASTLAEMIVSDSAVKAAASEKEKLALIEEKIQNSVAFFMNIHARFLFEKRFYARRREGLVDASALCTLMEEAQREAFSGTLGKLHPHFWASKLHFYLTDVPFYNFPYTFGYLFSCGIYARAMDEGRSFADKYVALLRDTGRLTVEQLAEKHLGVRLDDPSFWRHAVALTTRDIDTFLEMTK